MLKVWTNDCDLVVAESADEAIKIAHEFYGSPDDPSEDASFRACDDDRRIKMCEEDGSVIGEKTFREWADEHGRGYLGCTEV